MAVQLCTLVDVRDPADRPLFVYATPQTPFTDNDGVSHSGRVRFDYASNALPSTAKVPRSDAAGNSPTPILWKLQRIMGTGTRTWTDVLLDADAVNLNDLAQVPGSPVVTVPVVTQVDGHDPDAEGHVTTGTPAALTAEVTRATAAETANATAITAEAATARAAESANATAITAETASRQAGDTANAQAIVNEVSRAVGAENGKQPLDSDLTAVAALDSTTAGSIGSDGAGWVKKTWAQVKTALGLVKADVGLGNVDNTADSAKPVSTAQQTALDGKVATSRQVTAGTGLTGGGDLSADRAFAVAFGTTGTTAAVGNDARLSDTRTPTDGTVTDAKVASGAAIAESKLSLASDAAPGTASRRTLGTGANQALRKADADGLYDATGAATAVKGLPLGLTGAVAAARFAGGTVSGPPTSGTFAARDYVVDATGEMYICTAAGTPGTWIVVGAGVELAFAQAGTPNQTFTTEADVTGASITFTTGSRPVYVHVFNNLATNDTLAKPILLKATDESNVEKARNLFFAPFTATGGSNNLWERISAAGTYTRKVRASNNGSTGTVTVYTTVDQGCWIRAVTA